MQGVQQIQGLQPARGCLTFVQHNNSVFRFACCCFFCFFKKKKPQPDKFGNYLVNVALRLADNKTSVSPPRRS